jgi:ABC-type transport system substrate-binding protein
MPGYRPAHVYPLTPDVAKARALAAGFGGRTAVLYTCDATPCPQQAQIIKTDLAAIGLRVEVKAFSDVTEASKLTVPHAAFDLAWIGWLPDYLDPAAMLNELLADPGVLPTFDDPRYRARLDAAARLIGTKRLLAYAKLDADLVQDAAPLAAFGNLSEHDFFSARMGCVRANRYGIDLAALCVRAR